MNGLNAAVIGDVLSMLLLTPVEGVENFPYSQIAVEQTEVSLEMFSHLNPLARVPASKLAKVVAVHPVVGELLDGHGEIYGRFAMQDFFSTSFRTKSSIDRSQLETYTMAIDSKHGFVRREGKKLIEKSNPKFIAFNQIYRDYMDAYTDMIDVANRMEGALSLLTPDNANDKAKLRIFIGQFMRHKQLMESIRLFMQSDYIVATNARFLLDFPVESFKYSGESPAIYGKAIANQVMRTVTDYAAEEIHNKLAVLYGRRLEDAMSRLKEVTYRNSAPFSFRKSIRA